MSTATPRRKAPPVPGWVTYNVETDIAFLTQWGWVSALDVLREETGRYSRTSKAKPYLYLLQLLQYVERQYREDNWAKQREQSRKADLRSRRIALAEKLLQSAIGDDCGSPNVAEENVTIKAMLPALVGDLPDAMTLIRDALKLGTVEVGDLLTLAVQTCDDNAKAACDKREYGPMNRWAGDAQRIETLRHAHFQYD